MSWYKATRIASEHIAEWPSHLDSPLPISMYGDGWRWAQGESGVIFLQHPEMNIIEKCDWLSRKVDMMHGVEEKPSRSDGSTASYYELPEGCKELQDLISYRNMNAQDGEIIRAIYRKGRASHSDALRDAKKVLFYAKAEVERLEKYGKES